jgi:uncharacterized protein
VSNPAIRDLGQLLRTLEPAREPGVVVFAALAPGASMPAVDVIATFREREGLTIVVEESTARAAGITPLFRAAWITLTVHSDLAAVGLTAAVAGALATAGIACNVIAAAYHDHLFVPVEQADDAMAVLGELAAQARSRA